MLYVKCGSTAVEQSRLVNERRLRMTDGPMPWNEEKGVWSLPYLSDKPDLVACP